MNNVLNFKNLSPEQIEDQIHMYMYMYDACQMRIEENRGHRDIYGWSYGNCCAIPKIKIESTCYELSVQGSENHYCSPRENNMWKYDKVEIGFPNFDFSKGFIKEYAEDKTDPQGTVYGYVPMSVLALEIYNLINN